MQSIANWDILKNERLNMIRNVLQNSNRWLTARQLQTRLTETYGMTTHTNMSTGEIAYYLRTAPLKNDIDVLKKSRGSGFRYAIRGRGAS